MVLVLTNPQLLDAPAVAKVRHLFQAARADNDHEAAVIELLGARGIEQVLISVAFARSSGVHLLAKALKPLAAKTAIYVGIRNDITSAQALLALRALGVELYVVDTGRSSEIFHPKIYLAVGPKKARAIVGSANVTSSGLGGNIEGSAVISLDLTNIDDRTYIEDLVTSITRLQADYPKNVIRIKTIREVVDLLRKGRVADERIRTLPISSTPVRGTREAIGRMPLKSKSKRVRTPSPRLPSIKRGTRVGWAFLWESDDLSERDLNIPSGASTNPTGSMTLRKGKMVGIDHRHYFRDTVFAPLAWAADTQPGKTHLELAIARFEVIIKGINYGEHELQLRHDSRTTSASYKQNNAMTHLRWGALRPLVAKRDLLGETLKLFRKRGATPSFALEIT